MNINETELRKKLNLVIEKLLNLGGPDNAKELEENGGEAIGFFARDLVSVSGTGHRALVFTDF